MRLKYYLRGLGIGIIVTALLMGYSNKNQAATISDSANNEVTETSDESIGMQTLSDVSRKNNQETVQETEVNGTTNTIEETDAETEATITQDTSSEDLSLTYEEPENESTEVEAETVESQQDTELPKEVQELLDQNEVFVLDIARGDDSGTVSRKLYNAGLVDNASEFDAFLMQHGYDKRISIGRKEITRGSTWIEIAEKLSK